jgi:hypothetical protein
MRRSVGLGWSDVRPAAKLARRLPCLEAESPLKFPAKWSFVPASLLPTPEMQEYISEK